MGGTRESFSSFFKNNNLAGTDIFTNILTNLLALYCLGQGKRLFQTVNEKEKLNSMRLMKAGRQGDGKRRGKIFDYCKRRRRKKKSREETKRRGKNCLVFIRTLS